MADSPRPRRRSSAASRRASLAAIGGEKKMILASNRNRSIDARMSSVFFTKSDDDEHTLARQMELEQFRLDFPNLRHVRDIDGNDFFRFLHVIRTSFKSPAMRIMKIQSACFKYGKAVKLVRNATRKFLTSRNLQLARAMRLWLHGIRAPAPNALDGDLLMETVIFFFNRYNRLRGVRNSKRKQFAPGEESLLVTLDTLFSRSLFRIPYDPPKKRSERRVSIGGTQTGATTRSDAIINDFEGEMATKKRVINAVGILQRHYADRLQNKEKDDSAAAYRCLEERQYLRKQNKDADESWIIEQAAIIAGGMNLDLVAKESRKVTYFITAVGGEKVRREFIMGAWTIREGYYETLRDSRGEGVAAGVDRLESTLDSDPDMAAGGLSRVADLLTRSDSAYFNGKYASRKTKISRSTIDKYESGEGREGSVSPLNASNPERRASSPQTGATRRVSLSPSADRSPLKERVARRQSSPDQAGMPASAQSRGGNRRMSLSPPALKGWAVPPSQHRKGSAPTPAASQSFGDSIFGPAVVSVMQPNSASTHLGDEIDVNSESGEASSEFNTTAKPAVVAAVVAAATDGEDEIPKVMESSILSEDTIQQEPVALENQSPNARSRRSVAFADDDVILPPSRAADGPPPRPKTAPIPGIDDDDDEEPPVHLRRLSSFKPFASAENSVEASPMARKGSMSIRRTSSVAFVDDRPATGPSLRRTSSIGSASFVGAVNEPEPLRRRLSLMSSFRHYSIRTDADLGGGSLENSQSLEASIASRRSTLRRSSSIFMAAVEEIKNEEEAAEADDVPDRASKLVNFMYNGKPPMTDADFRAEIRRKLFFHKGHSAVKKDNVFDGEIGVDAKRPADVLREERESWIAAEKEREREEDEAYRRRMQSAKAADIDLQQYLTAEEQHESDLYQGAMTMIAERHANDDARERRNAERKRFEAGVAHRELLRSLEPVVDSPGRTQSPVRQQSPQKRATTPAVDSSRIGSAARFPRSLLKVSRPGTTSPKKRSPELKAAESPKLTVKARPNNYIAATSPDLKQQQHEISEIVTRTYDGNATVDHLFSDHPGKRVQDAVTPRADSPSKGRQGPVVKGSRAGMVIKAMQRESNRVSHKTMDQLHEARGVVEDRVAALTGLDGGKGRPGKGLTSPLRGGQRSTSPQRKLSPSRNEDSVGSASRPMTSLQRPSSSALAERSMQHAHREFRRKPNRSWFTPSLRAATAAAKARANREAIAASQPQLTAITDGTSNRGESMDGESLGLPTPVRIGSRGGARGKPKPKVGGPEPGEEMVDYHRNRGVKVGRSIPFTMSF